MPIVHFTAHLEGLAPPEPMTVQGCCISDALECVFERHPRLKTYVLDDQDRVRKHVAIFVDGELLRGDAVLETPVQEVTEIHVLQALSGG